MSDKIDGGAAKNNPLRVLCKIGIHKYGQCNSVGFFDIFTGMEVEIYRQHCQRCHKQRILLVG